MGLARVLAGRRTEYCGKPKTHDYKLYLAINDIERNGPHTNGICERFHSYPARVLPDRVPVQDI
jgi:hypothetical protein